MFRGVTTYKRLYWVLRLPNFFFQTYLNFFFSPSLCNELKMTIQTWRFAEHSSNFNDKLFLFETDSPEFPLGILPSITQSGFRGHFPSWSEHYISTDLTPDCDSDLYMCIFCKTCNSALHYKCLLHWYKNCKRKDKKTYVIILFSYSRQLWVS